MILFGNYKKPTSNFPELRPFVEGFGMQATLYVIKKSSKNDTFNKTWMLNAKLYLQSSNIKYHASALLNMLPLS